MPDLSLKQHAAVSRICATLARLVTSQGVSDTARGVGVRLPALSKEKKIRELVLCFLLDGRTRATAGQVIAMLTMEGHRRTVSGQAAMTHADVDAVVEDMRLLALAPGELARAGWRRGLTETSPRTEQDAVPRSPPPAAGVRDVAPPVRHARRREQALAYIIQLDSDNSAPQQRGRELEKVILGILHEEGLDPSGGHLVNLGEEIDLAFVLDGQHYLVECKWESAPIGQPVITLFSGKVGRKAIGTFGIVLSMSGFTQSINATASTGEPLRCVGITHDELIQVLEGRSTFAEVVRRARTAASRHSTFYLAGSRA